MRVWKPFRVSIPIARSRMDNSNRSLSSLGRLVHGVGIMHDAYTIGVHRHLYSRQLGAFFTNRS